MGTQKGEARHCQAPPGLVRLPPNCHALVLLRAKLISAAKVSPAGNRPCSTIVNGGTGAGAEWHSKAEGTPQIEAVRIFGSRAKETARRDSDLDLAITASNGNYVALADRLEAHLRFVTGLLVKLHHYNADELVRAYCDVFSIMIFSRS
jgi:predicted nucleotidyltransferase